MNDNMPSAAAVDELARPTWERWRIVALLVSFSFMTWFNRVSMSVAYDEHIKDQFHITPETLRTACSTA